MVPYSSPASSHFQVSEPSGVDESKFVTRETFKGLAEAILNKTSHSEGRIESVDSKFKEFAIQITDQLQRQETRATKSWVSL